MPELSRHDSELSGDSGYASSPHTALPTTNSINSQYLEALYSTKASLAYFAKSALSRARADFQHGENSIQEDSLLMCLQNLILSDDDFNCKYENYLPNLNQEEQYASFPITEEERKHLVQKFKKGGGEDHEINESTLQREINDLKIREYLPFTESQINVERNSKSLSWQNLSLYTKNVKRHRNASIQPNKKITKYSFPPTWTVSPSPLCSKGKPTSPNNS